MKLLFIFLLAMLVSACTTPSKMNVVDLNYYQIDCNQQEEQLAFLQRQMPTRNERYINALRMTSMTGSILSVSDGTYMEERATFDRRQEAIARLIIYQIHSQCPPPKPKPQGCVHINENLPAGSSSGARCYQSGSTTPAVNRWQVD